MREWILTSVSHPAIAATLLALGLTGILAEFVFPGKVVPGAMGGVLALLGVWALLPEHPRAFAIVVAPFAAAVAVLLAIAARARRNKRAI